MPWCPLIFLLLFGGIYGDRLLGKKLHRLSPPYAADYKNSDAQRIALLEGMANENFISGNIMENGARTDQQHKPYYPCQQTNPLEPYYDFIDCVTNSKLEANNLIKKNEKNEKAISNSRDRSFPFNSMYNSNNLNGENKNENSKIETYFSSDMSIPNDMEILRSSLAEMSGYNIGENYDDLLDDAKDPDTKRGAGGAVTTIGCDCKIKNDLLDLGQRHFPRYLLNAVCQSEDNLQPRCWRGICKPLEYKVKVLTFRTVKDHAQRDPAIAWLPDDLRQLWKFKTVTVAAGCFCAIA